MHTFDLARNIIKKKPRSLSVFDESIQTLQKMGMLNAKDKEGNTLVLYTIIYQWLDGLKLLCKQDADLNIQDNQGKTALIVAASCKSIDFLKELIRSGANFSKCDHKGYNALTNICSLQYSDEKRKKHRNHCIKLLIDGSTSILNTLDDGGYTPLQRAIQEEQQETIDILLEYEPDIDQRGNDGKTALSVAIQAGCLQNVETLLKKGASTEQHCEDGSTPLITALYSADEQTSSERRDICTMLLENQTNINLTDGEGNTALHVAAICNNEEVLTHLIRKGADFKTKNKEGNFPHDEVSDEMARVILDALCELE